MDKNNAAEQVFSEWAEDDRAERMWRNHLPRVEQMWSRIPQSTGHYLEIGCGAGRGLRHIAENQFRDGNCIGIDISKAMVALANKNTEGLENATVKKADFLTWNPQGGITFDAIFSMEVFYYFPSIQKGLDRAFSMLVPGGQLFVLVDLYAENPDSHDWSEKLGVPMQMWSKSEYSKGFAKAGFGNIEQILLDDPGNKGGPEAPTLCTYGTKAVG